MTVTDRDPIDGLDPRYFQIGDVVERPPAERPQHDTIEAIIDWLAGPAQHVPSLSGEFDEFAWRMLAAGFPLLRATLHCARCTRNISVPTLSGGAPPAGPCSGSSPMKCRMCTATKITRFAGCWWTARRCGAGSMSPMTRSISRSCVVSRPRARPTTLPCRSKARSAPITW